MKKNFLSLLIFLFCSMSFVTSAYAGPNEHAGIVFDFDATTYGNQNEINISSQPAGTYLRVDVYCTKVHNLDTYEFEVLYDQTELEYISSSSTNPLTYEENILTSEGGTAIGWMTNITTPGVLGIAYTLAGTDTTQAPEGEGLVADIVFRVLVNTRRILSFGDVHFYDSFEVMDVITDKGIAIPYEYGNINGSVKDFYTDLPIEGALISAGDYTDTSTSTDGTYLLEYIPIGIYDLICTAIEYHNTVEVIEVLESQTVTKNFTLVPFSRGTLDGTVTDENTDEPIENALITAVSQNKVEYIGFTNGDGYYIIEGLVASQIAGNYTVTCEAGDPYDSHEIMDVEIIADDTTTVDFELLAPVMDVNPLEIFPVVANMGDSTTINITFSNTGTAPFDWQWNGTFGWFRCGAIEPLTIDFPAPSLSNVYTSAKGESSLGFAPEIQKNNHLNRFEPVVKLTRGTTGWAYNNYYGEYFYSFDTDMPGTANIINSSPNWKAYAGDFDAGLGDGATYYIIRIPEDDSDHMLARVDLETGIATDIGPMIGTQNYMWTGLSCDKSTGIMYAIETYVDTTKLYTVDLATGTSTFIGGNSITSAIDIAVDGDGVMWTYSVASDSMYTLDIATGKETAVGPIGFDANFAQGMSWDPETDQVYLTAFDGSNEVGEFRVLDRSNGNCVYIGTLPDGDEVCALGFKGAPWVTVKPTSGTIEPGSNETVHATVYWLETFSPGERKYADIIFTPDPNCGEQTVSVTATFGGDTPGSISGTVILENTPYSSGSVEDVLLIAVSQVYPNNYYTVNPDSTGEYIIQNVYPDTYDVTATLANYNDTTIVDVVVLENQNTPNIDFEMICSLGALQGTVTDGVNPVVNAEITVTPLVGRYVVYTDSLGRYEINPIIAQEYELVCEASGFAKYTTKIEIIANEILTHNIIMGNPTIDVTPSCIEITLPPDTVGTEFLTISNGGNAILGWKTKIEETQALDFDIFSGLISSSSQAETNPNQNDGIYYDNSPTKDLWDILFGYDVDTPSGGSGIAGAEFGNGYFLVSEWGYSSRYVFRFDAKGNYISRWKPTWIPGTGGLRDMAFDGEYFYGSDATNTIYQFDEDGTLYGKINSPVIVRSIAYDEDNDAFWVNDWESDIKLIDRSGTILNTISSPPSMFGSAYDNISKGGPYLWIFTGTINGNGCQIEQYNLNTLTLTGVSHSVSGDFGNCIAGGLFTSANIVSGKLVLGGVAQGGPDILFGYELGDYISWVKIEPTCGTVVQGCDSLVTVYFDTNDLEAGEEKEATISFFSIPDVGTISVPVTLTIKDVGTAGEPENYETGLLGNFPNPFGASTTIRFSLKEPVHVKLSVYNIRGQLVNRLIDEDMLAGAGYQVEWMGTTSNDKKLANGIYFYKLETGNETFLKKMILMR